MFLVSSACHFFTNVEFIKKLAYQIAISVMYDLFILKDLKDNRLYYW